MTTFDKREQAFELKFAHDEELRFKANARRNRLVGMWAATKLGLTGPSAEAYAKALVIADLDKPGSNCVFEKILADFKAKGMVDTKDEISRLMDEFMKQAIADMELGK
jgi:hypothetical protein